jgi:predicted HAD superfamily Cof-like phosphohydrolase
MYNNANQSQIGTKKESTNTCDMIGDIYDMHTKFGVREIVKTFDKEKLQSFLKFRLDFLKEELLEAYEAAGYKVDVNIEKVAEPQLDRAEDVVDAMIDLCVVAIGTLDAFQVDTAEAWNRVHTKNMEKEPGIKPSRPNPLGLPDLCKPIGWTAPTHADNVGLLAKAFE